MTERHDENKPAQENEDVSVRVGIARTEDGRFVWRLPLFGIDSGPRSFGTQEAALEDADVAIANTLRQVRDRAEAITSQKLIDVLNVAARANPKLVAEMMLRTIAWPAGEGKTVPMNPLGLLNAALVNYGQEKIIAVTEEHPGVVLVRGFVLEATLTAEERAEVTAPPPASRIEVVRADAALPKPHGNGQILSFLKRRDF